MLWILISKIAFLLFYYNLIRYKTHKLDLIQLYEQQLDINIQNKG